MYVWSSTFLAVQFIENIMLRFGSLSNLYSI